MIEKEPTSINNKVNEGKLEQERFNIGKSIVRRIKGALNKSKWFGDQASSHTFESLYLVRHRTVVPDFLESDDSEADIISVFYFIYSNVIKELKERSGLKIPLYLFVEPSSRYPDRKKPTYVLITTTEKVVAKYRHLRPYWKSEDVMEKDLSQRYCEIRDKVMDNRRQILKALKKAIE